MNTKGEILPLLLLLNWDVIVGAAGNHLPKPMKEALFGGRVDAVGSSFEIGKTGTNKKGQAEMRGLERKP